MQNFELSQCNSQIPDTKTKYKNEYGISLFTNFNITKPGESYLNKKDDNFVNKKGKNLLLKNAVKDRLLFLETQIKNHTNYYERYDFLEEVKDLIEALHSKFIYFKEPLIAEDKDFIINFRDKSLPILNEMVEKGSGLIIEKANTSSNSISPGETITYGNDSYKIIEKLGAGTFGIIFKVENSKGEFFAMKFFDKAKKEFSQQMVMDEFNTLSLLDHQNIIKVYDTAETDKFSMIRMEYVEGVDGDKYIKSKQGLDDDDEFADYIKQIINAFAYCHSMGIYHSDMKLENIIIDSMHHNIKIIDFGMAVKLKTLNAPAAFGQEKIANKGGLFGSPGYISPEHNYVDMINKSTLLKDSAFALGATFFNMIKLINDPDLNNGNINIELRDPAYFGICCCNDKFIYGIHLAAKYQEVAKKRIPDTNRYKELIIGLLDPDPQKRLTNLDKIISVNKI